MGRLKAPWLRAAALGAALLAVRCGIVPERVSRDDPRVAPMFDAMARVNRRALGFTSIERDADIRLEWTHRTLDGLMRSTPPPYDAMLRVSGRTSRTVAFTRAGDHYDWVGEQETFEGPHRYTSVDGTFNETLTITYERVPITGFPRDTAAVVYAGDQPELAWPRRLSLDDVRPLLKKWGYE